MKQGVLFLLSLFSGLCVAAEDKVYLMATLGLGDSTVAKSILLHEPDVTDLEGCAEAVRLGQRDNDWLKYHHILNRDKIRGFSVQLQYRCVIGNQNVESWYDRSRYDHSYLFSVDDQSRLSVRPVASMAACMGQFRGLSADDQARSHCAKGSQQIR